MRRYCRLSHARCVLKTSVCVGDKGAPPPPKGGGGYDSTDIGFNPTSCQLKSICQRIYPPV